jgi:hypothetical protein
LLDAETFKWLGSMGVGGILAGLMFLIYRKDAQQWQAAWKGQSESLLQVVKENTTAITSLVQERRDDRTDRHKAEQRTDRLERNRGR